MLFDREIRILKDESPLLEAFIPEYIPHREGQKQLLADCLRPLTNGRKARNVFLYGPTGTGKTLLAQWIMNELKNYSTARTVYVNCWKRNTIHTCLVEILNKLEVYPNYRQATTELVRILEKEGKNTIVCLDEIDMLQDKDLLYDISRSGIGIITISNDAYALMDLDLRIKSSLVSESIEFPAYKTDEIFDILQHRKKFALLPGVIKDEDLKMVARLCNGDARIAIETLRRAALLAEDKNKKGITSSEIKRVFDTTKHLRKTEALKRLNAHEKTLYQILEKEKKLSTQELFDKYCKKVKEPCSERTYRNYMKHLTQLGLVKAYGELTGRKYEWLI